VIRYNIIEELFNEGIAMEQGNTECAPSLTKPTDCEKCQARERKLQFRIVKALEGKRYNKAKSLQHLLNNSMALKCIELQSVSKEPVYLCKR
jgi:hypothetical protein